MRQIRQGKTMSVKKNTYNYKPIRILKRSSWEIIFCKMFDIPVRGLQKDDYQGMIRASLPTSLESMKIWELCSDEKYSDCKYVKPYEIKRNSDNLFSCALISVSFPKKIEPESLLWMCATFINKVEEGEIVVPEEINGVLITQEEYDALLAEYRSNQEYHEKLKDKTLDKYERKTNRDLRFEHFKKCRDIFTGILLKCIKHKSKEDDSNNIFDIRSLIYIDGFNCEFENAQKEYMSYKYVLYKRSAGKAKKGSCMFIMEGLYKPMIDWTWLGKDIQNKKVDLTSARAYEALVSSSICNTVKIPRKSILLIESKESGNVGGNIRILAKEENDALKLYTTKEYEKAFGKTYENTNKIWDGQALVDESIFKKAGYCKGEEDNRHGMMLLRNSFFKACAFNTRISDYYKKNNIKEVTDMFGVKHKASEIKMIVTTDSLKFMKYADIFFDGDKKSTYEWWIEHVDEVFGIVKEEHASHLGHGKYHEVSYQFLNTLPIHEQDDIDKLLAKDLEYINLLKNNSAVLMHRMRYIDASLRKKYFIYQMFKYVKEFKDTEYFKKNYLKEEIDNYRNKLREGRLKLKGDFYCLCSMPFEMLEYSARNEIKPQLEKNQVYIKGIAPGEKVTLIRYPQLNSGSVCSLTNVKNENYEKWFNFDNKHGSNIVVVSPWNSNIMVKLGGCDFDSDTVLYIRDEVIQKVTEELMGIEILEPEDDGLPVGVVDENLKSEGVTEYLYDKKDMALLDNVLVSSGKNIGVISNNIQLLNSYLWEEYFKGEKSDAERIKTIYGCILKLSCLNEMEIDSAKHRFAIDLESARKEILKTSYKGEHLIQTKVERYNEKDRYFTYYPFFLYDKATAHGKQKTKTYVKRAKGSQYDNALRKKKAQVNNEYWNCPMDLICQSLIKTENENNLKGPSLEELFEKIKKESKDIKKADYEKIKKSYDALIEGSNALRAGDISGQENDERTETDVQQPVLDKLWSMKINDNIKIKLFDAICDKYKTSKDGHKKGEYKNAEMNDPEIRYRYLGLLFALDADNDSEPSFIHTDFHREDLMSEEVYLNLSEEKKRDWEPIDLWGENWYYNVTFE